MINMTLFGVGAAGNKAAITALERGVIDKNHVKLLNTSVKDVPEEYKKSNMFIPFSSGLGGCGKEYARGRNAIIKAINTEQINFAELLNEDSRQVVLVSSIEGGTGSGSVPAIAKYFTHLNVPVHVFAFVGFQDEIRGCNNSLRFFKDLPSTVILHTINNSYFLDYTKNYATAERAANEEFANQLEILRGSKLIPSNQVIDDTDLYKLNTQEGYMIINHINIYGIKSISVFNEKIQERFENPSYMDTTLSCKRLGVIINASKNTQTRIDNSYTVIKRYVGEPLEIYQHIQDNPEDGEEYIDIICSGMEYPEKPILDINSQYQNLKSKINKPSKSFKSIFDDIDIDDDDEFGEFKIKKMVNPDKVKDIFSDEDSEDESIDGESVNTQKVYAVDAIDNDSEWYNLYENDF